MKTYDADAMDKLAGALDKLAHEHDVSFVGIIRCVFKNEVGDGASASSVAVALGAGLCGAEKEKIEAALRHTGEVLLSDANEIAASVVADKPSLVH